MSITASSPKNIISWCINQNEVVEFRHWTYLQAEADYVSDMGDDDGHLTLYELIEHLHSLAGMVLYIQRKTQSFTHETLKTL